MLKFGKFQKYGYTTFPKMISIKEKIWFFFNFDTINNNCQIKNEVASGVGVEEGKGMQREARYKEAR
jgi:hypothetical protein